MPDDLDIVIEPYKKIIVHEVVEYKLADFVNIVISRSNAPGGSAAPVMYWCNGVVFQILPLNPNSETVIAEQMKGIIHYSAVTFAVKSQFEKDIRTPEGLLKLVDQSMNENFTRLCGLLRERAKYTD